MTHTTDHYERPRSNSYSESNIIACNRGRVDLRAKSPHFARAEQVAARGSEMRRFGRALEPNK